MLTGEEFWRLAELEGGEDPAVVGEFGAELSLGAVEEPEQSWCCWGGSGGTGGPRTCPAGRDQPPTNFLREKPSFRADTTSIY